jgi:hypothetical protein
MVRKSRLAKDGGNRHLGNVQNDGLIDRLHPGETARRPKDRSNFYA